MLVYPLTADVPTIKEVFNFLLSWMVVDKELKETTPKERLFTATLIRMNFKFIH